MEAPYGFFEGRRPLDLTRRPGDGRRKTYAEYKNVPAVIGALISSRIASLHELSTVYGLKDAYDMLEVITVDDYNRNITRAE